jgi:hypothetical protein
MYERLKLIDSKKAKALSNPVSNAVLMLITLFASATSTNGGIALVL